MSRRGHRNWPRPLAASYVIRAAQPANLLLLPLLACQGAWVKRNVPRLAAASCEEGQLGGAGPAIRMALAGDSMAAGVGVEHNDDGLAGQLAAVVAGVSGRPVSWKVTARPGATAAYTTSTLVPQVTQWSPDIVAVAVGVNDVLRLRSFRAWRRDVTLLICALRRDLGRGVPLVLIGVPPVRYFKALPQPLRSVLGSRALVMDRTLGAVASRLGAVYVAVPTAVLRENPEQFFARDRLHPSALGYTELGQCVGPVIASQLSSEPLSPSAANPGGTQRDDHQ